VSEGKIVREWLRQRPWIWIVVFFVLVIVFSAVLVIIAVSNQPIRVG
jgi:hypothetical protein